MTTTTTTLEPTTTTDSAAPVATPTNALVAADRKVVGVFGNGAFHWVGDGFRVTQVLPSGPRAQQLISPFLMLDYHAPHHYEPTTRPRGVGVHPHRGFETVTLALEGAIAHHDSTGAGDVIRPGDVQWMTAAKGILHKEYHEPEWAKAGGLMHMVQLWVNLPAANKMDEPGYQPLLAADMGVVPFDGGTVTVIAGEHAGVAGPARTHTPIQMWRVELDADGAFDFDVPSTDNVMVLAMEGSIDANGTAVGEHHLALFENEGDRVRLSAGAAGAHVLVLAGTPIDEPVVSYGPFVMNTVDEIQQAYEDFARGAFGHLDD